MSGLFETGRWSLELPKRWVGDWKGDVAILYDPDGVGALQISEYQKLDTEVTNDDLLDFVEKVPNDQVEVCSTTGFKGFHYCYRDDTNYWETWLLRNGSLMLFVTYNCEIADAGVEKQEVLAAVRSISPSDLRLSDR